MFRKFLLGICVCALGLPLGADVLITQDGSRVKTRGSWVIKGRQVIFTLPNGTLSAMRANEIDFEASRAATDFMHAPAPTPPRPTAAELVPIMVLTNKDLPEVIEGKPQGTEAPSLKAPGDRQPVQVVSWQRMGVDNGLEIHGTIRNTGQNIAANIVLQVQVKNGDAEVVETVGAFLTSRSLVAGRSTSFRAVLTEVTGFVGEPIFLVSSTEITLGGSAFGPGENAGSAAQGEGGGGGQSTGGGGAAGEASGGVGQAGTSAASEKPISEAERQSKNASGPGYEYTENQSEVDHSG